MSKPMFSVGQVVMELDHNPIFDFRRKPTDLDYRVDTGRFHKIERAFKKTDGYYYYRFEDGKFGHQSWLRALTGREMVGGLR